MFLRKAAASLVNQALVILLLAVSDANIAAQNAVTAAQSLGIGSCYIGDIMENCETHRELLESAALCVPGGRCWCSAIPTQQQIQRPKPVRCRLEDIVQENRYFRRDGKQLRKMFEKECAHQSFDEWCEKSAAESNNSDFSREMSRSVEKYLQEFLRK